MVVWEVFGMAEFLAEFLAGVSGEQIPEQFVLENGRSGVFGWPGAGEKNINKCLFLNTFGVVWSQKCLKTNTF